MMYFDTFEGVKATVQKLKSRIFPLASLTLFAVFFAACGGEISSNTASGGVDPNATAATVNGKVIKMEAVERAVKQQAQGQEGRLSPLELAAARLQVLQSLIEQEVMFQKAEKEGTLPSDEEVTAEFNKRKTGSGLSAEQFNAEMAKIGENEASAREQIRRGLAIQKLTERITGRIGLPSEGEIEAFFNGNREAFKNKRGAQLGAIVIDPANSGEGDTTKTEIEAQQKAQQIGMTLLQGADFATVARENSEDPDTRFKGGDWRYFSEEQMKQVFPQGFAENVMGLQNGAIVRQLIPFEGKYLIVKLQRKQETDEDRTLETPGVRQEITDYLVNSRKQLLAASYQAAAMNEAKIENYLAQRVVENPNELSGARPAGASAPAAANTAATPAASNTNTVVGTNAPSNTNSSANKPAANAPAKPAANANR